MTQDVADKKKEITDDDLLALITDEVNQPVTLWSLLDLQVSMPVPKPPLCFLLLSCCCHYTSSYFTLACLLLPSYSLCILPCSH